MTYENLRRSNGTFLPRDTSLNHEYFSNLQDNNVLYWAGFLMADGCIYEDTVRIGLAEKDISHLEQLKLALNSENKLVKNVSWCSKRNPKWKDSVCYHISFSSSRMVADLAAFGVIPRKTFTCRFPKIIKFYPNINNYCRGYFDGDGSICINHPTNRKSFAPYLMFSMRGTPDFLKGFNEVLVEGASLPSRCLDKTTFDKGSNIGVITYSGTPICTKIMNWLYKDIDANSIFLERKYNVFARFIR